MQTRQAVAEDLPSLKSFWEHAGYSPEYTCPSDGEFLNGFVGTLDGNIVAWAGGELQCEVRCVVNPYYTPHERSIALEKLHRPLGERMVKLGVEKAYIALDPTFSGFATWLMNRRWKKAVWELLWITKKEIGL